MKLVRATARLASGSRGIPRAVVGTALSGLLLAGCGAPPGGAGDGRVGIETQPTTTTTETVHSRAIRKWSNAVKFRGDAADYLVCGGDKLKLTFTFENLGSAEWFDVDGRGKKPGSDVFLVTASGNKDPITHKVHYSLRKNLNHRVRGDRLARNCSTTNGCRRTTFIRGGMAGAAPLAPAIYHSRWRLRDFSKAWGTRSRPFSKKVDIRIKVVDCSDCGCTVACSNGDGESHVIPGIQSGKDCQAAAAAYCVKGNGSIFVNNFKVCPPHTTDNSDGANGTEPVGGGGGSAGSGGSGGGNGGGGGSSGVGGGTGSGGAAAAGGSGYDPGSEQDPNGYDIVDDGSGSQEPDDPGYSDHGFNGDANPSRGSTVAATGCSLGVRRSRRLPPVTGPLFLLLSAVGIRRRSRRRATRG